MHIWFFISLIFCNLAMSHQTTRTAAFKEVRWANTNIPIKISNGSSTLVTANSIIDQSLAEWNQASGFQLQKTNFTTNNQIKFLNNFSIYGSAVVGLTEVSYNNAGTISSATIFLNEDNYRFVSTPGISINNNVYLKDVLTHELGHFVGLSHSEVLDSTMFYQTYAGQSELAADDVAGIRSKYDSGYGVISGKVAGGNHIGVLGVNVQAISRRTGEAISGFTNQDGQFEIKGLDLNDTYYLHTSRLKNLSSLPSYLANVQTDFCPSAYVPSFFSRCGDENNGIAQGITLSSSVRSINVGEVSIRCALMVQDNYIGEKFQTTFRPIEIFNFSHEQKHEKTYRGYFTIAELDTLNFSAPDKFTIDLSGLTNPSGKNLKIRLISQPFGNPVDYEMSLVHDNFVVAGSPLIRTLNPNGTLKLDILANTLLDPVPANNKFELDVSARKLTPYATQLSIPDAMVFATSEVASYLLVISIESGSAPILDTGVALSDNYSCMDAPFTYAVENSTAQSDETSSAAKSAATAAACGTIGNSGEGPGPGSFTATLSLGFLLSLLGHILSKRRKNFLS